VAHRHQSLATPLTPHGRDQIKEAAVTLQSLKPTHLLTSSVLRAVESAKIIGEVLDMTPETTELLKELERPVFLNGNFHNSLGSLWFYSLWYFGLSNHERHGGESYKDLRQRIKATQALLATYPSDAKIVVVSHSVFINFFLAHMCYEKRLGLVAALLRFFKVLSIKNASITKVTFTPHAQSNTCEWQELC
jgi:broad specificity phosphatase PhoE